MVRRLRPEEKALWQKVIESVRPLDTPRRRPAQHPAEDPVSVPAPPPGKPRPAPVSRRAAEAPGRTHGTGPGTTLDATWDRRLSRGLVSPDMVVDLHGHRLAGAHDLLDRRLAQAIAAGDRLVLLVTGKAPSDDERPIRRGAIRAAVGDWLAASPHARNIAAVRGAHPRHGGAGALYIVLRRPR